MLERETENEYENKTRNSFWVALFNRLGVRYGYDTDSFYIVNTS